MSSARNAVLIALVATACGDSAVVDPPGPSSAREVVVSGDVTLPDGNPATGAVVRLLVHRGPRTVALDREVDADGRFTIAHRLGIGAVIDGVDVIARAKIGQGYVLGTATASRPEARLGPVPTPDTTFVRLALPPDAADSRRPIWVRSIGSSPFASRPLEADSRRVYLLHGGCVRALDRETGRDAWCREGFAFRTVGGLALIRSEGFLRAVSGATGDVLWERRDDTLFPLAVDEPDLFVTSPPDLLEARDVQTGTSLWTVSTETGPLTHLALGEELACTVHGRTPSASRIACRARSDGGLRWTRPIGIPQWLTITDDRTLLGGGESPDEQGWTGLDPRDGSTIWSADVSGDHKPAVSSDGRIVVGCELRPGTTCVAVRTSSGSIAWRKDFEGRVSAPTTNGGSVFVATGFDRRRLRVLDVETGELLERIDPDPHAERGFCGDPVARDGMVFVFSCDGFLYAFDVR